jgi:hypothetical protein
MEVSRLVPCHPKGSGGGNYWRLLPEYLGASRGSQIFEEKVSNPQSFKPSVRLLWILKPASWRRGMSLSSLLEFDPIYQFLIGSINAKPMHLESEASLQSKRSPWESGIIYQRKKNPSTIKTFQYMNCNLFSKLGWIRLMSNRNWVGTHTRVGEVTYSITSDAVTQDTPNQIDITVGKDLLCGSCDAGSTKGKLLHDESIPSELYNHRSDQLKS